MCCLAVLSYAMLYAIGVRGRVSRGAAVTLDLMTSRRGLVRMKLIILSQTAIPFLIGTKFDTFATFPRDEQEEITKQVCRFVDSFGCVHRRVRRRSDLREQCMHR